MMNVSICTLLFMLLIGVSYFSTYFVGWRWVVAIFGPMILTNASAEIETPIVGTVRVTLHCEFLW